MLFPRIRRSNEPGKFSESNYFCLTAPDPIPPGNPKLFPVGVMQQLNSIETDR